MNLDLLEMSLEGFHTGQSCHNASANGIFMNAAALKD